MGNGREWKERRGRTARKGRKPAKEKDIDGQTAGDVCQALSTPTFESRADWLLFVARLDRPLMH